MTEQLQKFKNKPKKNETNWMETVSFVFDRRFCKMLIILKEKKLGNQFGNQKYGISQGIITMLSWILFTAGE
jgi:hypothetical protein